MHRSMFRSFLIVAALLSAATPAFAEDAKAVLEAADKAFAARDLYKAEALYKKAQKLDPKSAAPLRGLGRICRWQKRSIRARRYLEEALKVAPDDGLTHFFLGALLAEDQTPGAVDRAITHLERSRGLLPPDTVVNKVNLRMDASVRIGMIERKRGNLAAARAAYEQAHAASKSSPRPLELLAQLEASAGRLSEARTWLEKLIAIAPDVAEHKARLEAIKSKQEVAEIKVELLKPSVGVNQTLPAGAVLFRGYDDKKRIVDFDRYWEVSSGLVLVKTDPLTVKAGPKPSSEEFIYLTDKQTGAFAKARIRVLGPAVKMQLDPERLSRAPGSPAILHLRAVDAAGNRFPLTEAKWSITHGGKPTDVLKVTHTSGDSWRVEIPAGTALGSYSLVASSGSQRVVAQLDVVDYARPAKGKPWMLDLAAARAQSAKSGKPLMIYLWTVDCATCDKMAAEVFSDEVIQGDFGLFTRVRVNAANVPELLSLYRIKAIPTMLFLSPSGGYLARSSDYISAKSLHKRLIAVPEMSKKAETKLAALRKAATGGASQEQELAQYLLRLYLNEQGKASYHKVLVAKDATEGQKNAARLALAQLAGFARDFPVMEKLCDTLLAGKLGARAEAQAMYYKAFCLFYGRAHWDEAEKVWRALVKKHPRSNWARRARKRLRELY